jgi:DNA-directed RNA polymerase subunit beta
MNLDSTKPPGRPVDDPAAVRGAIFGHALSAVQNMPPVASQTHTLKFTNPGYDDPEHVPLAAQKQAIMSRQTVGRRLRVDAHLIDNTSGQTLDTKRVTLAKIPYYTDRGTMIDNGTEYTLSSQLRLKPGIYTREKDNGELESHVNVLPGQGVPHRIFLDPQSGIFRIRVGQAQIPLVPLLQAMGKNTSDLQQAWGNNLAAVNLKKASAGDTQKLYTRLIKNAPPADPVQQQAAIKTAMEATRLDPEVNRQTLGQPFANVSADAILATTRKLLAVSNRNKPEFLKTLDLEPAEQDDRDHLGFMRLVGPEDLIAERLNRGHGSLRQLLWRASRKGELGTVLTNSLNKSVRGALLESGLAQSTEGINPAMTYDQQMRITRMGYGGLPSTDSIPKTSRSVQPSHLNFLDFLVTPESERAGVESRMVRQLRKGPNGEVYAAFTDARTGQTAWKQPMELFNSTIAFPGPLPPKIGESLNRDGFMRLRQGIDSGHIFEAPGNPHPNGQARYYVPAVKNGKIQLVSSDTVDYQVPHMEQTLSPLANMVPMKSGMKGQRVAMAARMMTQALPIQNGESPFVQSGMPDSAQSFEEAYGARMGAVHAPQPGRVLAVQPGGIKVQYQDGSVGDIELAQHMPSARKTYMHQTPLVHAGQQFDAGHLLAKSNYVDNTGATALGLNVRTGYLPLRGYNFEDATVISESAARRFASQHMYKTAIENTPDNSQVGTRKFLSLYSNVFHKDQIGKLDDTGVIRVGQRIEHGDPIMLALAKRQPRAGDLSGAKAHAFSDQTETWEHESPGIVTDVSRTDKGVTVAIKSTMPLQIGDKVSGRFGNKGVVANVVPDHEMPIAEDGKPLEFLQNPLGVISRSNPSQVPEMLLGKITASTGQRYRVKDFGDIHDLTAYTASELAKHGMSDTESVTDPVTGRKIPGVLVGNSFLMKLHHIAESKSSARGLGTYNADEAPAKGGPEGSKTWGLLHLNAILSHGGTEVARDGSLIRGQRNPEYWAAVMQGREPADPPVPFVYKKFINNLKAAGINPIRTGTRTQIMALTSRDIDALAGNRVLTRPDTVDWNSGNLKPIEGGLFDEKLFGSAEGGRWAKIPLTERMPNPVMEAPIRKLLGMTQDQYLNVLSGKENFRGQTGPESLYNALDGMDVDKELAQTAYTVRNGRKGARDAAIKKVGFLLGIKKTGLHPRDWFWDSVPVLPPQFRPVSKMKGSDVPMVADPNYLYRDLFETNQNLQKNKESFSDVTEERAAVYQSMKAVAGLGDPAPVALQDQQVKGILKHVLGASPKWSVVQRRLLGSTTDLVGRSTIIPNPDLDMDEVGIPEDSAWKVYQPFIVRHLVKRGMSPMRAVALVHGKHDTARQAMLSVMEDRPLIIDRAPVLHRYGVMAFRPRLTKGHNLETSPIVIKGFGGDYDGDAMQFHVPASPQAVTDAYAKMLPSRNLLSVSEFRPMYQPSQEYLGGLHAATSATDTAAPVRFKSKADAINAFKRGFGSLGQKIEYPDS